MLKESDYDEKKALSLERIGEQSRNSAPFGRIQMSGFWNSCELSFRHRSGRCSGCRKNIVSAVSAAFGVPAFSSAGGRNDKKEGKKKKRRKRGKKRTKERGSPFNFLPPQTSSVQDA